MTDRNQTGRYGEQGFLLVGAIVMVALVLIFLGVAAPIVAKDLRREKELEAVNRGKQYTRALRLYYLKFNAYPGSIEMLEKTNNIRYLRKRYVDPLTGKDDWRTIPFGQAKTTVKGFFGAPLAGLGGGGGLGSAAGSASAQQPGGGIGGQSGILGAGSGSIAGGAGAGTTGTGSDAGSSGTAFGGSSSGGSAFGGTSSGGSGSTGSGTTGFGSSSFGGSSSSSSNPLSGGAGPFVGVGIKKDGPSIITLNEQTDYSTWEFIYDPRIEQLLSKVSLFGGGVASQSSGSLGSASGLSSTPGSSSTGSSSFGSSSFGSSSFGSSSGGSTTPTTPPNPITQQTSPQ